MQNTKLKKYIAGILGVAFLVLLSPNLSYKEAEAVTQFPPGSLLQPNDVTSSHIRNGTIEPEDLDQTTDEYWDLKGDLNIDGAASTTGALTVGTTLTVTGSCTGCSGTFIEANFTAGVGIDAGEPVLVASSTNPVMPYISSAAAPTELNFGYSGGEKMAQQFAANDIGVIEAWGMKVCKTGTPADNYIVELMTDSSDTPSGTTLATSTYAGASVNDACTHATTTLASPIKLTKGSKYWMVVRRSGSLDAVNYFGIAGVQGGNTYANGINYNYAGSWGADTLNDFYFIFQYGNNSGHLYPTIATTTQGVLPFIGFAKNAITASSSGAVYIGGVASGLTDVASGTVMYLSNNYGTLDTKPGTQSRKVCIGLTASTCLITNSP